MPSRTDCWKRARSLAGSVGMRSCAAAWVRGCEVRDRGGKYTRHSRVQHPRCKRGREMVDQHHAYAWSRTRKGGWPIAQSPVLSTTITLERLAKRGYESMIDHYRKVAPHLNEPLYTRPAWPAQSVAEGYSGVRGAPRRRKAAGPPTRLQAALLLSVIALLRFYTQQSTKHIA